MATREQNRRYRESEFEQSWKSYEWLIKERLVKIDEITRNMIREMILFGVPNEMIAELLPVRFEELKRRVVEENNQKFIHGRSFYGTARRSAKK